MTGLVSAGVGGGTWGDCSRLFQVSEQHRKGMNCEAEWCFGRAWKSAAVEARMRYDLFSKEGEKGNAAYETTLHAICFNNFNRSGCLKASSKDHFLLLAMRLLSNHIKCLLSRKKILTLGVTKGHL